MPVNSLKEIVSRKYGFWFYQLTGWGIFIVYDFFINVLPDEKFNLKLVFFWIIIILFAFSLTLLIRPIYRKIYNEDQRIISQIFAVAFISIICGVLWQIFQNLVALLSFFQLPSMFDDTLKVSPYHIIIRFFFLSWPIFVWSILYFLIKSRYEYQAEKEKSVQSQLLATEAQLKALRYQINPHFLFNTLISLQGLMYHNTKLADKMLTELSEFLRYTLRYNEMVFVPLEDEFEIIEKYLTIQKIRFGDKLRYSFSINPETRKQEVLCFLLQPLAENAVKYGITSSPGGVDIRLSSDIKGDWLILEIVNTGNFEPEENRFGAGLSNVRERLVNAYPDKHEFKIIQVEDKVYAIIKIRL